MFLLKKRQKADAYINLQLGRKEEEPVGRLAWAYNFEWRTWDADGP